VDEAVGRLHDGYYVGASVANLQPSCTLQIPP
jgi:hypothetical protein